MKRFVAIIALVLLGLLKADLLHADGPGLGNLTYTTNELFNVIARFTDTNGVPQGQGFVAMHHGYLAVLFSADAGGGNGTGGFAFFNLTNPRSPVLTFTTYNNTNYNNVASSNYAGEIREALAFSFYSNYVAIPNNSYGASGIQFWDWSNIDPPNPAPTKIGQIVLPALVGGDYDATPWWICWQAGRYAYVAGTSAGLYIIDASNPAAPVLVDRGGGLPNPIPTSQTGGYSVHTVFAVGNLLVTSNGGDSPGITMYDISDPANPVILETLPNYYVGYSAMVNGDRLLAAHDPAVVYDISDPANLTIVGIGPDVADKGGYGTFQDGYFHYGSSSAYIKLDISSLPFTVAGMCTPTNFGIADWDYGTPLGNVVFVSNDRGGGSAPSPTSSICARSTRTRSSSGRWAARRCLAVTATRPAS
jgi:hypothetical protein